MESIGLPPPEIVWGLVPRFVGVIYVLAFGSLAGQIEQIGGSRGRSANTTLALPDPQGFSRREAFFRAPHPAVGPA